MASGVASGAEAGQRQKPFAPSLGEAGSVQQARSVANAGHSMPGFVIVSI